ncbi:MAG: ABC transporter permease [Pseudanabaenaceae cyanobacterium SKYGB_i_bin29]|nr:ABC transporter permease [Pseudanabaenaceae cyanobacterium SKYG29]MDW8422362.1 ABC transporter permease [Pseudanabaenaceae cyanobacterium SKYGB_i_bin29]
MHRLLFRVGLGITLVFCLVAVLTPLLIRSGWLYDPNTFLDFPVHSPPSWSHWLGTDLQGHDVLARVLAGTGVALQVVLFSTVVSVTIGLPLGLWSGYSGGWLDRCLVFLMDAIYTIPSLLLSIAIAFVVGKGVGNAVIALSVVYIPQYFRLFRNQTVSVKNELYIEAARSLGASQFWILWRYVLPNVLPSLPVLLSLNSADAVLTLAGLGFLGLGVPPEIPEWGHDLKQALDALSTGEPIWWTTFFPGLAITLLVTGLSLVGEGLKVHGDRRREMHVSEGL